MKRGIYGKYNNMEYKIIADMDDNILIMTKDRNKIDGSFKETKRGELFKKIVKPEDLSECINIVPYGLIDGDKVNIMQERDDKYQIETSNLLIGTKLNLPRVDRDSWLGWVPMNKVTLIEEKKPFNPFNLV
ncbi:hypothetical protein [Rummeliibacillus stabekisii]|uniref:Uncharacterized protein n=1 Tax=Rummeliibacillus stabekisii TaxID=241244 RepID=A0A143HDQ8_9BACL|nr:hypothetical protein [Rummeliibacillus stabekisii]AMW99391.1 hypothetical protein ATY39_07875 [Rummeliibacillus stabekisii]